MNRMLMSPVARRTNVLTRGILAAAAAAALAATAHAENRTFDGTGNNLSNTTWGSTGQNYSLEASGAHYADGISTPNGTSRPGARQVSNVIVTQGANSQQDPNGLTGFIYMFGQFVDHDLGARADGVGGQAASYNIPVPTGDTSFDPTSTGTQIIPAKRSAFDASTGTSLANPRLQTNAVTSFLDAGTVYGNNTTRAAWLRTNSSGLLKTTANPLGDLLPYNDATQSMDNPLGSPLSTSLFVAGDDRANQTPELTSLHTLFVREHNRVATELKRANPAWTDEQLYQRARKVVGAELQAVVYNDYLPSLLGPSAPAAYAGYNASINPAESNAFAVVGFRFGHTTVDADVHRVGADGSQLAQGFMRLRDVFVANGLLASQGNVDPFMRGLAFETMQKVDTQVIEDLRSFLFGAPGQGGLDLPALDVQRGRDHGLADYNTMRQDFGLAKVTTFAQITSDPTIQAKLQSLYASVDDIDPIIGALAEDHASSALGALFNAIIKKQFENTRDADRLYYENDSDFTAGEKTSLGATRLADLIRRNSLVRNIQDNVFKNQAQPGNAIQYGAQWNLTANGSWNNNANWTSPATLPNGAGKVANFFASPTTANAAITLDAAVTVGSILFSDNNDITISNGTGGSLTLNNQGSTALIQVTNATTGHTISATTTLYDSALVYFTADKTLTLSGTIGESNAGRSITIVGETAFINSTGIVDPSTTFNARTGGGTTTLSGPNTFTGGLRVINSQVAFNHLQAAGLSAGGGGVRGTASAEDQGTINLGVTPDANSRFAINDLGAIQGSAAELGGLTTSGGSPSLVLAAGAVLIGDSYATSHTTGLPTGVSASTSGTFLRGYAASNTTAGQGNITVGATSSTPWRGIASNRLNSVTWGATTDIITASGGFDLAALGTSTLTVAAKITGGVAGDTLRKRGGGTVQLNNAANNFAANTIAIDDGTFKYNYAQTTISKNFTINTQATLALAAGDTTLTGNIVNKGQITGTGGANALIIDTPNYSDVGDFRDIGRTASILKAYDATTVNAGSATLETDGVLFQGGRTYTVNSNFIPNDTTNDDINLIAKGAGTVVNFNGYWDGDGGNTDSFMTVVNGGKIVVGPNARIDTKGTIGNTPNVLERTFRVFGFNGGVMHAANSGTVEFADGFRGIFANWDGNSTQNIQLYAMRIGGGVTWITNNSDNQPLNFINADISAGWRWKAQTHDQTIVRGFSPSFNGTMEVAPSINLIHSAIIQIAAGVTLTKEGAGTWTLNNVTYGTGSAITATAGNTVFNVNPGATPTITATGAGATVTFNAALTTANTLATSGGTIALATGGKVYRPITLSISGTAAVPTSTLNLSDGKLILDYAGAVGTTLSDAVARIKAGRNGYDGNVVTNWNGKGIVSSAARANSVSAGFDLYSIGIINNASLADPNIGRDTYTTFGAQAVDSTTVLARYTYAGDADLNGFVDGDDYALIDNAYNLLIPNFGWLSGDFNYDGNIDGDDYALIDSGYLFQGAPIASAAASVPEPASLGLLALGALTLLKRRR